MGVNSRSCKHSNRTFLSSDDCPDACAPCVCCTCMCVCMYVHVSVFYREEVSVHSPQIPCPFLHPPPTFATFVSTSLGGMYTGMHTHVHKDAHAKPPCFALHGLPLPDSVGFILCSRVVSAVLVRQPLPQADVGNVQFSIWILARCYSHCAVKSPASSHGWP